MMKPEEKTEIILWDWLKTKSKYVEEIYFNRKNKLNSPVFKTKGITSAKPDLIMKINDGYGIKFYAIEVKNSEKSKNILNASKIIDKYLKDYINKKTTYLIENKEIKLKGYLIATDSSLKGYLFRKEIIIDNTIKEEGKSKYYAATQYKIIPKREGGRTFEFIRLLWELYSHFRNDFEEKLDVGILIGNDEDSFSPYLMITNYYELKKRWSQRWWKI